MTLRIILPDTLYATESMACTRWTRQTSLLTSWQGTGLLGASSRGSYKEWQTSSVKTLVERHFLGMTLKQLEQSSAAILLS